MQEINRSSQAELKPETLDNKVSGSLEENLANTNLEHLNFKVKRRKEQQKAHENIETRERENLDIELLKSLDSLDPEYVTFENVSEFLSKKFPNNSKAFELSKQFLTKQTSLGLNVKENKLGNYLNENLKIESILTIEDQIKNFTETIRAEKSSVQVLHILIEKYGAIDSISTLVDQWKNFLKLHQFAEDKSPAEKKVIQRIISNADFTAENSFDMALAEISDNTEISSDTKLEITKKFGGENVHTVSEMDSMLKNVESHKKDIEIAISSKTKEVQKIEGEIANLEKQIEALDSDDPKRKELEDKLADKSRILEQIKTDINFLNEEKPQEVSFPLRSDFSAKLNSDGSRSIRIDSQGFEIKLPDNRIFQGRKNMLAINLAFSYRALHSVGMESLFSPKLASGEVPDKRQRMFSGKILSTLGYPTDTILSDGHINQLKDDLSMLKQKGSNSTGMEDATALGIYDISTQEVNMNRLTQCLSFIKQNRGKGIGFEELKSKQ